MRKYCFLRYCSIIILFCYSDIWVFAQKNITIENDVFFNDFVIPILNEGNTVTFFAKGKSMEPTIKDGEKVCLKKLNENIKINFIKIDSLEKAKNAPCIFNNWANFYKGEFLSNTILNANSFEKLIK